MAYPLLPLVGQKLALANKELATAMMSFCIIAAQLVMMPIALFAGRKADQWGRKPVLLIGFAILPVRALLYPLSNDSAWLITVQTLDGVGAGIWSVLTPLVVADLMRGIGRYNLALGGVATAQSVGASLSGLAAGLIVDRFGYDAAFATSAAVALSALAVLGFAFCQRLCHKTFNLGLINSWCKMETQGFGIPLISHRKSPGERPPPRAVRLRDAKLPNSCDLSEG